MVFAKFKGMDTPEAWLPFRRQELFVPEDELVSLPKGQYYIYQLIGLDAFDEAGALLGSLTDVLQTGSNDVYVIETGDGNELLIPAIDRYVRSVDLSERRLVIEVPEYW
jgi:16S rRNA processing protein RimM